VFTLQVGEATAAPPTTQWYIIWNRTSPDANADRNYVAMKSSAAGVVSFEHGTIAPTTNLPTRVGAADDGSYDPATGTIRIIVANSSVDGVGAGQSLMGLHARVFSRPDGLPVTQSAANDFSPSGLYTLVGNESCRANAAPTATLSRSPAGGCVPVTIMLDGSQSADSDPGDTVASYHFNFGDGTPDVVQSSPTISHDYSTAGDFGARLLVTDSRGKNSLNIDQKTIQVAPCPIDELRPLVWDAGSKDSLSWPSAANATGYRVYRGVPGGLPNLQTAGIDSCVRFEGTGTSTGPVFTEIPPADSFYWYLVVGVRGPVDGSAGNGTAYPRIVNASGSCP
jgi:hypothetical protein